MRRLLFLFLLLSTTGIGPTSGLFRGMDLRDGIYRDFQAFQTNRPTAPLSALRDAQGLPVTDIRRTRGTLSWQPDTGAEQTIDLSRIWGFCQNDVVYIATGNGFYRIGLMGGLSHLVVQETYRDWDPYMYGYPYEELSTATVLVQQLLDMETGYFLPFNAAGMDKALLHDPVLSGGFVGFRRSNATAPKHSFAFCACTTTGIR